MAYIFSGTASFGVAGAANMTVSMNSATIPMGIATYLSATLASNAATRAGTVSAQTSDDGTNWSTETLSGTPTVATNTAYCDRIDIRTGAAYARFVYTATSGTGILTGVYTLKG